MEFFRRALAHRRTIHFIPVFFAGLRWTIYTVPCRGQATLKQFEDTFLKVIGSHTISLGGNLVFWQTNGATDPVQVNGLFTFNGPYSSLAGEIPGVGTISDLADLELGYPSGAQYTKNAIVTTLSDGNWSALFAQDNFRLSPRFNIQYGLRREYRRQPMERNNQIAALYALSNSYTPGDARRNVQVALRLTF